MSQTTETVENLVVNAVNRCIEAYREVRAQLLENSAYSANMDNQEDACRAYLSRLPLLTGPQAFQTYIACISHGASIGAIDPVDVGRFCHIAHTAMAAWKLANPALPAAQTRERAAREKDQKQPTPHPSKGNQAEIRGNQIDLRELPGWDQLQQHYQLLRDRGVPLVDDEVLARNPLASALCCDLGEWALKMLSPAGNGSRPQAAPAHSPVTQKQTPVSQKQPQQAA